MSLAGNISNLARLPSASAQGYGDVDGPASSTNNAIALFNGTGGKTIKNSAYVMAGAGGTITVTGNATLNQDVSTAGSPTFVVLGSTGNLFCGNNGFQLSSGTTDGFYSTASGLITGSRDDAAAAQFRRRTSDGALFFFYRDTTEVGTISVTTTNTAYNTSSDVRLKTNIRDLTDSGAILDALKPRIFDWKSGASPNTYGFIAQETYAVFPQAVTKGDDGETITQQWAIDASKLVPVLVAELKSLRARVAELEANK